MFSLSSLMLLLARKKTIGANTAKLPRTAQGDKESQRFLLYVLVIEVAHSSSCRRLDKGPKCHAGRYGVAIRGSTGSPP
jgi:hypothetical protein